MSKIKSRTLAHQSALNLNNCEESNLSVIGSTNVLSRKGYPKKSTVSNSALSSTSEECIVYHSMRDKTKKLADTYSETDQLSHRYLAYRDIPRFIKRYIKGNHALDYGTGTGISAAFLLNLGFNVIGTDINSFMLEKARESFPQIQFFEIEKLIPHAQFDLIFSSFVLFDMKSKKEIVNYLNKAASFMKKKGVLIAVTGSEELYSVHRNWIAYDSDFDANQNLRSGDTARLRLRNPVIEFCDYFWTEKDYLDCFQKSNWQVLKIHKPLGSEDDPYLWEDEKFFAPFTVYILEKQ